MVQFCSIFILLLGFAVGCGTPTKKDRNVIGTENPTTTSIPNPDPVIIAPSLPEGAVIGNYNGDLNRFYAHVSSIDNKNGLTYISFENSLYPVLLLPKTYGGTLSTLAMEEFDRDLLLVTARLKDPNFNKYFLYVLRNNEWKPVMNSFAIHKSNLSDTLVPLQIDLKNPKNILRNYSVFNLDTSNEAGYSWLLMQESVPIENW